MVNIGLSISGYLKYGWAVPPTVDSGPRHICFVISKLGIGGAEKNLLLLTRHLPRTRYAPVVLSLNGEGPYADRLRAAGVPVYSLGLPHPLGLIRLVRFFRRCSFDLFHGFMFHGNIAGRLFGAVFRRPRVCAVRVAEGEKRWHLWLDRLTSSLVDCYTVNSRSLAEFVRDRQNVAPEKISLTPNALAAEDLQASMDSRSARADLKIPRAGPLVAMIGRLHPQKDPETFVRAARRIVSEVDGAHFLIAGIGPLEDTVRRLIREMGLESQFHLPGLVSAHRVLAACDLFVLPSRWEGFPNAAIEAMAAGRAVILADFSGASEVVDYGVTGLVFPKGDDRSLAEAAVGLLKNESVRQEMGKAARATVTALYSVERMVSKNMEVYDALCSQR